MKRGRGGGRGAKSGAGRAPPAKKRKAGEADDSQQDHEDDMETTTGLTFAGTAQWITTLLFIYSFIERINCLIFSFLYSSDKGEETGFCAFFNSLNNNKPKDLIRFFERKVPKCCSSKDSFVLADCPSL